MTTLDLTESYWWLAKIGSASYIAFSKENSREADIEMCLQVASDAGETIGNDCQIEVLIMMLSPGASDTYDSLKLDPRKQVPE